VRWTHRSPLTKVPSAFKLSRWQSSNLSLKKRQFAVEVPLLKMHQHAESRPMSTCLASLKAAGKNVTLRMIRQYGIIAQLERLRSSHSRLKTSPHSCANKCARLFKSMHQKYRFNGGGQSSTSFNGYLLFLLTRRCRCRRGRLCRRGRFGLTSQRGPFPKQLKRGGSSAAAGAQRRGVVCGSARDDGYMYAGWIELCFRFLEDLFMLPTVSLGGVGFGIIIPRISREICT